MGVARHDRLEAALIEWENSYMDELRARAR
jgi:hypothetical protein